MLIYMYILNIDTSSEVCSVSLSREMEVLGCKENKEKNSHSSQIALLTNQLLKENNLQANQLSAIAINKGPGSYTGLRIGTAFAKGLCYALNIPLIAIDGLKILAQDFLIKHNNEDVDFICPMLDARRMEVYTAIFDKNLTQILPTQPMVLNNESFDDYKNKRIVFVGNGCSKFKFLISQTEHSFMFFTNIYPNSLAIAKLSYKYFLQEMFEDIVYFEPQYLKDFLPTTPKNKLS